MSVSVGSEGRWETAGMLESESASEYLHDTLGDVLAEVLLDCANNRPDDPIAFLAAAFVR